MCVIYVFVMHSRPIVVWLADLLWLSKNGALGVGARCSATTRLAVFPN